MSDKGVHLPGMHHHHGDVEGVHTHTHDGHTHTHVGGVTIPDGPAPRLHLRGTILPEGEVRDLWVVDGTITFDKVDDAFTVADGGVWIMPGLVDAHCHVGMARNDADESNPLTLEQVEAKAVENRDAGVLLIREPGSPSDVEWVRERDDLPRFIGSGKHIATPKRYLRDVADEVDPEDLPAAVERQAAAGDGWIKLVGDWIERGVGDLAPLFTQEQARAGIDRAHELGCRVTAHSFGEQSAAELVAAGIDGLEHGTGITDDVIDQMAENQVALVPTLINIDNFPTFAEQGESKFPAYAAHMRDLHARSRDTFRKAREAGVPIFAGTDAGGFVDHGQIAAEIEALGEVGDPEFALGAASWRAREWLGVPGIEEGASADLVVFGADPRQHLGVARHPLLVLLRGRVVRS